jgi:dihydrofolate synthase / folylpolyglutamate synthase
VSDRGPSLITTYDEAVAYLDAHIGRGMHPGLERINGLLDLMGRPDQAYPIAHIAGTNGKTSTSRMTTMLLVAHGLTTGTFISPHLERVEERFSLNGYIASPEQFVRAVADVAAFADIYEERFEAQLSYFELTAAVAFSWFADQAADAAVIEVGLGGRLDATNACSASVAVLTQVGLEHQEYLGDTVELIAAEKLGIVEPGATLITGKLVDDVWPVVDRVVAERQATEHRFGRDFTIEGAVRAVDGWHLDIAGVHGTYEEIHLPIRGRHQSVNFAVAVAAAEAMIGRELDHGAVVDAASVMSAPGRLEPIGWAPFVLLDGAHNPDGFVALSHALREEYPTVTWVLLTAAMQDKDIESMYPRLAGMVDHVVVTQTPSPNAIPADDLAAGMRPLIGADAEAVTDPEAALARARELAGESGSVLVAGSLYLVGIIRSAIKGDGQAQRNER